MIDLGITNKGRSDEYYYIVLTLSEPHEFLIITSSGCILSQNSIYNVSFLYEYLNTNDAKYINEIKNILKTKGTDFSARQRR